MEAFREYLHGPAEGLSGPSRHVTLRLQEFRKSKMSSVWPLLLVTPFVRVTHCCAAANWYRAEPSGAAISFPTSSAQKLKNHSWFRFSHLKQQRLQLIQCFSPRGVVSGVGESWGAATGLGTGFTCRLHPLPDSCRGVEPRWVTGSRFGQEQKHHQSESLRAAQSLKSGHERQWWQLLCPAKT